jgi:hypothetical protein
MDSKNSLKLVFLLFSIFIVHLFLYYFFPSYGNYFKNIKYDWNIKTENEYASEVNDNKKATIKWVSSYTWSNFVIPDINSNENEEDILIENENNPELVDNNNEETNKILDENNTENTDIILDDTWKQEIFDLFSDFNLEQKEKSKITSLFGLTNEYPYDFEEYYSKEKKMNLYVFKDKPYEDILNIFDVISYNLYFKIKKVNNFWDKSFFINLDQDLDDNYIRFVFSYKNNNFWLKIKKDWYNEVKKIMKSIWKTN